MSQRRASGGHGGAEKRGEKGEAVVDVEGVTKAFVDTVAVDDVSLTFEGRRVYGLVGHNGAGKSTLLGMMRGFLTPDSGRITVNHEEVTSPREALGLGVVGIEQSPNLASNLTGIENIALGLGEGVWLEVDEVRGRSIQWSQRLGVEVDLERKVEELSISQMRRLELVKLFFLVDLFGPGSVVILDEVMLLLSQLERDSLKGCIKDLALSGCTVIVVSHELKEVKEVSDPIIVMEKGRVLRILEGSSITQRELVTTMFGGEASLRLRGEAGKPRTLEGKNVALLLNGVRVLDDRGVLVVKGVDLTVYEGETHGVAVIPGTGELEFAEAIYGARRIDGGRVVVFGEDVTGRSVREMFKMGVSFLPDDRIRDGLVEDSTVEDNLILGDYNSPALTTMKGLMLQGRAREALARRRLRKLNIMAQSIKSHILTLSGGNRQRVCLARMLDRGTRLLIALHPLIGLDLEGTYSFFSIMKERRMAGKTTVLFMHSPGDLKLLCDRISVINSGRITGTYSAMEIGEEELGFRMSGIVDEG